MRYSAHAVLVVLTAATIATVVSADHSSVPVDLSLRVRLFDPKYDSAEHGQGITVNSTMVFRHGSQAHFVSGGEVALPGFDDPQRWGVMIDGDARLQDDGTALINVRLENSSRFAAKRQDDVHLVDGQLIHVSCPVKLGQPKRIQCAEGRTLEILLNRSR